MLQIRKKGAIIVLMLLSKFVWTALIFLASLILSLALFSESNETLAVVGIFLPSIVYILFIIFDTKKYVDSASIQVSENTIDFHAENLFSRNNNSLPIAQINNATVSQGFIWKLFGIAGVGFLDETGLMTSLWGFNYDDSVAFVKDFSSKYKIKITS